MGVRVTKDTLVQQLKIAGQEHFLELPYHQAIINDRIPLSIGGGIGQSRTFMYLLRTATWARLPLQCGLMFSSRFVERRIFMCWNNFLRRDAEGEVT